jgi:hypothetical protein
MIELGPQATVEDIADFFLCKDNGSTSLQYIDEKHQKSRVAQIERVT